MYEFAGSKSAKLVVSESGKLVARFLQSIACLTRVQIYYKLTHVALCFAVFHNILFQKKMDSIQNNLKTEMMEETEEEKIDIENHFHPVMSSCEEDQLTRSVC
jgi:hypothetical protein